MPAKTLQNLKPSKPEGIDMRKTITILLLLLLLTGFTACARNKAASDMNRLRAELLRWENFSSRGVVQLNYMGFALRKFYVAQKNGSELRLDVVDGGVMGAGAAPLISIYKGDYLAIKSTLMPQLEMLDLDKLFPSDGFSVFASLDSLVASHYEEISSTGSLSLPQATVGFDRQMRITGISESGNNARLSITYDRRGDPDKIEIVADRSASIVLLVDSINYRPPTIEPLPRPAPLGLDLMRLFEQQMQMMLEDRE